MADTLEYQIHRHAANVHDPNLTPIQDLANSLLSASLAKSVLYPLDAAQILMQTNAKDARDGLIPTLIHLYNTYGISSWWRGNVASCCIGTTIAIGKFLGSSPALRNIATTPTSKFLVTAAITTAIYPLHIAKIRMIVHPEKYKNTVQTIQTIYKEEELLTLFKGLPVTILGFLVNCATTAVACRLISSIWKKPRQDMTWWEAVISTTIVTLLTGLVQYPIDTAVKIVQATPDDTDNVVRTLLNTGKIPRAGGFAALYSGFTINFLKPLGIPLQAKISDITLKLLFAAKRT
jgi:hypothetical protein